MENIYQHVSSGFSNGGMRYLMDNMIHHFIPEVLEGEVREVADNKIVFNTIPNAYLEFDSNVDRGNTIRIFSKKKDEKYEFYSTSVLSDTSNSIYDCVFDTEEKMVDRMKYSSLEVIKGQKYSLFTSGTISYFLNEQNEIKINGIYIRNRILDNNIVHEYEEMVARMQGRVIPNDFFEETKYNNQFVQVDINDYFNANNCASDSPHVEVVYQPKGSFTKVFLIEDEHWHYSQYQRDVVFLTKALKQDLAVDDKLYEDIQTSSLDELVNTLLESENKYDDSFINHPFVQELMANGIKFNLFDTFKFLNTNA